jgi:hypothetical protein
MNIFDRYIDRPFPPPVGNSDETIAIMITITIYEYLAVNMAGDGSKRGLVLDVLEHAQGDTAILKAQFTTLMQEFKASYPSYNLDDSFRETCDHVTQSFDEHSCSPVFYQDVKLALHANDQIMEFIGQGGIFGNLLRNLIGGWMKK